MTTLTVLSAYLIALRHLAFLYTQFIARNTTTEERTTFLASVTAVNVLGFIMGPALTTVLSLLDFTVMGLEVNQYTGPGWLLVIMFFVDLLMVRFLYEDSSLASDANGSQVSAPLIENDDEGGITSYGAISSEEEEDVERMESGTRPRGPAPPSSKLVLSLIFTQFTVMCAWSVLETITSPLAYDSFGWSVQECNILFTCGGAASLLAYVTFVIGKIYLVRHVHLLASLLASLKH